MKKFNSTSDRRIVCDPAESGDGDRLDEGDAIFYLLIKIVLISKMLFTF